MNTSLLQNLTFSLASISYAMLLLSFLQIYLRIWQLIFFPKPVHRWILCLIRHILLICNSNIKRSRQEDIQFISSLGYIARSYMKKGRGQKSHTEFLCTLTSSALVIWKRRCKQDILKRVRSRSVVSVSPSETAGQAVCHTCVNTALSLVVSGPAGLGKGKDDPCVVSTCGSVKIHCGGMSSRQCVGLLCVYHGCEST